MNIGGRIKIRLDQLNWERKDLLDRVPDLTSQALFNLIKRDSVRSEWDERIAEALGVSILWLVYGKDEDHASRTEHGQRASMANDSGKISYFPNAQHAAVVEVVDLMNKTDELGKGMILSKVRDIAKERSRATNKAGS